MPGQIRKLLEQIIEVRSRGNPTIAITTRTKLVLKGLDPEKYGPTTEDDPKTIARVLQAARDLGVTL